ncbi:MAG TPA: hypothetical protein VK190_02750 [Pseudoneobacillus sp.]|nr:hypothetical protein [Pseudoneobacillus sp.]
MIKRIAISGKIASGKTTLTSILTSRYDYKQIVFAAGIKKIAAAVSQSEECVYDVIKEVCLNDLEKTKRCFHMLIDDIMPEFIGHDLTSKDNKARKFYQIIGQSFKEIDKDIWIKHAISSVSPDDYIVVDDMRFKRELNYLKQQGFITVRLEISPKLQLERINNLYGNIDPARLNDISEVDLDDVTFDYVIDASLSTDEIEKRIINIINI